MGQNASIRDEVGLSIPLSPVRFVLKTFLTITLLASLAIAIQVGWSLHEQGAQAAKRLENLLVDSYDRTPNKHLALIAANAVYVPIFHWTHVDVLLRDATQDEEEEHAVGLGNILNAAYPYVLAAMYASKLVGLRLATLLQGIGLIGAVVGVTIIDGYIARLIRKAEAGRESASIYHRARLLRQFALPFAALLYCAAPIAFDPGWVILPASSMLIIGVWLQCKYFKKYI